MYHNRKGRCSEVGGGVELLESIEFGCVDEIRKSIFKDHRRVSNIEIVPNSIWEGPWVVN